MLFIENSYLKDFETTIKKIDKNNIILEQTAFYAKSGGQPGDIGKIIFNENKINITDTIYDHEKNLLSSWNVTGYGEHGTESSVHDSLTRAVDLALRDVGVNLVIKIEDNFEKLVKTMSTDL